MLDWTPKKGHKYRDPGIAYISTDMNRYMNALSHVTNPVSRLFVPRMRSVENRSTHAQIGNLIAPFAYLEACFYLSILHCEALNPTLFKLIEFGLWQLRMRGRERCSFSKSNILKRVGFRASKCIIDR